MFASMVERLYKRLVCRLVEMRLKCDLDRG
jgi:hypothetical protein